TSSAAGQSATGTLARSASRTGLLYGTLAASSNPYRSHHSAMAASSSFDRILFATTATAGIPSSVTSAAILFTGSSVLENSPFHMPTPYHAPDGAPHYVRQSGHNFNAIHTFIVSAQLTEQGGHHGMGPAQAALGGVLRCAHHHHANTVGTRHRMPGEDVVDRL